MAVTNGRSTSQWRLKVIRLVYHHPPPYCVPVLLAPSVQGLIAGRMGLCQGKQSLFLSARLLQQVTHIPRSPLIRLNKPAVSLSLSALSLFTPSACLIVLMTSIKRQLPRREQETIISHQCEIDHTWMETATFLFLRRGKKRTSKCSERERPSDEREASVKFVPAVLSVLKLRWNIKSSGRDCLFGMRLQMRKTGLGATVVIETKLRFIKQLQTGNWWEIAQYRSRPCWKGQLRFAVGMTWR